MYTNDADGIDLLCGWIGHVWEKSDPCSSILEAL